ncbi:MAG: gamma-glutamyltransferase [Deltaproteobacteria bacterium]|nr:gamma-glutamyltransferase [Deltaproteobacteria bacterium]
MRAPLICIVFFVTFDAHAGQLVASKVAVATANRDASEAAVEILRSGGNAFDAAVTAALVLSVAEPQSSGIGGGGFATIYDARMKQVRCLDFRERAPILSHRDLYVREGKAQPQLSQTGALAVGVPGQIAGLIELHKKYGKKPLAQLFDPAVKLAQTGVTVSARLGSAFLSEAETLARFESTKSAWTKNNRFPETGGKWLQPDLAKTLKAIQAGGLNAFYKGDIARRIVDTVVQNGGILALVDLAEYEVKWREPVMTSYRGYSVFSQPPPSSGGVHLVELLNMLETKDPKALGFHSPAMIHFAVEAMRRVYADRATFLGDPGFTFVPVAGLVSKDYAKSLLASIDMKSASKSEAVNAGKPDAFAEHKETTHFSIIDADGNAVAITTTVNGPFGSALVASGTGVLLNNQMDDFAIAPGVPNLYGLVGSEANSVAPRKTPLSSMTPTIVLKDDKVRWALGSPGGSTIITTVFWALVHLIDFDADVWSAIALPRVHEQWRPDHVSIERFGLDGLTQKALKDLGHTLKIDDDWGNAQIVGALPDGRRVGASDPRGDGSALGY